VELSITAFGDGICADASDLMILTIWQQAEVYAGANDFICAGETFQPFDADAQYYNGVQWSTTGDGTFSNNSILHPIYTPGPNDISAGTVTLTLTAFADGTCADVSDDLTLTIDQAPTVFAGADAEICDTDGSYQIADASASNYTGLLWISSGTGSFNDPSILNPIYTPSQNDLDDGFVTLTLTAFATGTCDDATDEMVLTITPAPTAFAGADTEICESAISYIISDANASDYSNINWSSSGDGSFNNNSIPNPEYTPGAADIAAGTVQLTLTAFANGSCTDVTDNMTLTISPAPTAFAGTDAEICESDGSFFIADASATNYSDLQWTTSGTGSFDDNSILNPIYTPSQNDIDDGFVTLTLTALSSGLCDNVSDNMILTISPGPIAFAGADKDLCETEVSYTITDATASDYASLDWSTSGDGFFVNPNILNATYVPGAGDILNGSVQLSLTAVSNGLCADATDEMTLSFSLQPTAFAGDDIAICETDGSYEIVNAVATNYSGVLWITSGSGSFNDPTLVNPVYSPSQNDIDDGFVVLTITAFSGGSCENATDEMTLSITSGSTAFAGADAEICETTGSYFLADALASDYASLLWTSSGDGIFNNNAILNPEYMPGTNDIANGTVQLTLTAYANGLCTDASDDMILTITKAPIVFAGPDDEICESEQSYELSIATAVNFSTVLWTSDGTGSFDDPNSINPVYIPSESDILDGQVRLSVTAFGQGSCSNANDEMLLTIWKLANVFAGLNASICEGDNYQLWDANAVDFTSLLWTTSGDGAFSDPTELNPVYTPGSNDIINGLVALTLTVNSAGTCPEVSDDLTLTISEGAQAFAGPDDEICESDQNYTLSLATASNYTVILWTTDGSGSFDDPNSINAVYTPSASDILDGQVMLSITASGDGNCSDVSDEMLLTIWKLAGVFAGIDASICEGDSYQLWDANAVDFTTLLWTTNGDGYFSDATALNPVYNPGFNDILNGSMVLTLTASSAGSCPNVSDDLTLSISGGAQAFAGVDNEICESSGSYFISDATASGYTTLLWTSSGSGSFDNPSSLNPIYTPSQNDIEDGYAVLTLTATGIGNCEDVSDDMVLTITTEATAYAGTDSEICETVGSYAISDANASGYASLVWTTSGDGSFNNAGITYPLYTPGTGDISSGSVQLTLTAIANGMCTDASDMMILTISEAPTADAGNDAAICVSDGSYLISDASASNYSEILWTSSGSGSFNNPASIHPVYTPSQNDIDDGSVILTLTAYANGTCEDAVDEMILTITSGPIAFAGADAEICETASSYFLSDATASDYAYLAWTSSGDGSFNNSGILNPEYTPGAGDIANGSVQLTLTAFANGSCTDATDEMTLNISKAPQVFAGPDDEICESEPSYTLSLATGSDYTTLQWTTDGTGTFNDPNIINPIYTPSASDKLDGQVRLSVTAFSEGSCPDASDEMLLTIWKMADAFAGIDATICEGDNYQLWDAEAVDFTAVLWTSGGDGSFSDPTVLNPVYSPGVGDITTGSVILTLTANSAGSCPAASDALTLNIIEGAQVFAGEDASICETDLYTLTDATASNYANLTWSSAGDGYFDDPTLLNPVYTPGPIDKFIGGVLLTLEAFGGGSCDDASDQVRLTLYHPPVSNAGINDAICAGDIYQLNSDAENYTLVSWSSSGDGGFDNALILDPVYTPGLNDIQTGSVALSLTVYGFGSCGSTVDEMLLNIWETPVANAGSDQTIPNTTATQLDGNGSGGSGNYTFMWEPQDLIINPTAPHPHTFTLTDNENIFILTILDNESGCMDTDTVFVFTGQGNTPPVANDDYDTTFINTPVTIDILSNDLDPNGDGLVISLCRPPDNGLVAINSDGTITYTPYEGYTGIDSICYVICDNGTPSLCDSAMVYISIEDGEPGDYLTIFSGFTPNGDGLNDRWIIENIGLYPDNIVLIFNRWGDIVNQFAGYDNTNVYWKGDNKFGEKLPDGTYYYILKIRHKGEESSSSGWIFMHGSE
jgi:gliding motility-associated-like protein